MFYSITNVFDQPYKIKSTLCVHSDIWPQQNTPIMLTKNRICIDRLHLWPFVFLHHIQIQPDHFSRGIQMILFTRKLPLSLTKKHHNSLTSIERQLWIRFFNNITYFHRCWGSAFQGTTYNKIITAFITELWRCTAPQIITADEEGWQLRCRFFFYNVYLYPSGEDVTRKQQTQQTVVHSELVSFKCGLGAGICDGRVGTVGRGCTPQGRALKQNLCLPFAFTRNALPLYCFPPHTGCLLCNCCPLNGNVAVSKTHFKAARSIRLDNVCGATSACSPHLYRRQSLLIYTSPCSKGMQCYIKLHCQIADNGNLQTQKEAGCGVGSWNGALMNVGIIKVHNNKHLTLCNMHHF